MEGKISELLGDAHKSKVKRVARRIHDITKPTVSFTQAARATILAGCGAVGMACKIAFSYGTELNPAVAANFLAKLTRLSPHTHVLSPPSAFKSPFVPIPIKAVSNAFIGMPKKSAPMRDG